MLCRLRPVFSVLAAAALLTACGGAADTDTSATASDGATAATSAATGEPSTPANQPSAPAAEGSPLTLEEFAALSPAEQEALPREQWPTELRPASELDDEDPPNSLAEDAVVIVYDHMLDTLVSDSVTIEGTGSNKGEPSQIYMAGSGSGFHQQTTIRTGDREFTYLIYDIDTRFVKGNEAFWKATLDFPDPADVPAPDKWVPIDANETHDIMDHDWSMISSFQGRLMNDGLARQLNPAERGPCASGECFIIVTPDHGTFYITTDGTYTLERFVGPEGSGEDFTLSEWGSTPGVSVPDAGDIHQP